jgi:hypothetical protein
MNDKFNKRRVNWVAFILCSLFLIAAFCTTSCKKKEPKVAEPPVTPVDTIATRSYPTTSVSVGFDAKELCGNKELSTFDGTLKVYWFSKDIASGHPLRTVEGLRNSMTIQLPMDTMKRGKLSERTYWFTYKGVKKGTECAGDSVFKQWEYRVEWAGIGKKVRFRVE